MKKLIRIIGFIIVINLVFIQAQGKKPTLIRVDSSLSIDEVFQLALENANEALGRDFDTLIEGSNWAADNKDFARAYSQKDAENKHVANGNSHEALTINIHKINNALYYSWAISQVVSVYLFLMDSNRTLRISRKGVNFTPALVSNQQNKYSTEELADKALDSVKEKTGLDFSDADRGYSTLDDVIIKKYFIVSGKELTVILFNKKYIGQGYFWFTKQCIKGDMKYEHMDGQVLQNISQCH